MRSDGITIDRLNSENGQILMYCALNKKPIQVWDGEVWYDVDPYALIARVAQLPNLAETSFIFRRTPAELTVTVVNSTETGDIRNHWFTLPQPILYPVAGTEYFYATGEYTPETLSDVFESIVFDPKNRLHQKLADSARLHETKSNAMKSFDVVTEILRAGPWI